MSEHDSPNLMRPLAEADAAETRALRGLVFDLDDTLLTHGRLTHAAYEALWMMHEAGLTLIAATGRPIGWAEIVARQWPIDGVVAENGALFAARTGGRVHVHNRVAVAERESRTRRLQDVVRRISELAPTLGFSDDAHHRRTDVAWDIGEHVHVDPDLVERLMQAITAAGAYATRSSVHMHASFDVAEKADGIVAFATQVLRIDGARVPCEFAFVGDSPNDESCFRAFAYSVGVAHVRDSLPRLGTPPRFVTLGARGEGFRELADHLLVHRRVARTHQD